MKQWRVDINCDVGEGVGNEAKIFPLITSCNIACGGHAGDKGSMRSMIKLAKQHDVKIGAHPSYPDPANFGRKVMQIPHPKLKESLLKQLRDFSSVLKEENATLHHIKPHGALYNEVARDENLAALFLNIVKEFGSTQTIYAPFGSCIAQLAPKVGVRVIFEVFGDRSYNNDGSLVSRQMDGAIIHEPKAVLEHILPMIKLDKVRTLQGNEIQTKAETICIHGDTSSALEILTYLSHEFPKHKLLLRE
ncbi:5-oxoprolinase subunit PxpA [Flagellimonas allohymeniacidonis]|uniref:5-oxoprolinase subunit PxpA n=1 Tax=Flagellimonas allohymeniacidonis TaxID=2517819 RepID=A0A4Q8QGT7_9FLAO|nr:5-oxoprolinase subunit PxpA [Allomuricauda hymeniacidonis]TAI48957.1 5-oxoprolinase subunit PxpA [Allomuricauda hymeniacidonis]